MGKPCLNRVWLEGLSNAELAEVASEQGVDASGGSDRVLIIEELLELAREDGGDAPPAEPVEPVPLPKQYNITYLDVLVRDPFWVFAFWEIKSADRESLEKSPDFGGYYLRVLLLDGEGRSPEGAASLSFVVNVGPDDGSWYLGFPPVEDRGNASRFQVALCGTLGGAEEVLARAGPFRLPAPLPAHGLCRGQGRLRLLSGLDEIPVLRGADGLSPSPRGGRDGR